MALINYSQMSAKLVCLGAAYIRWRQQLGNHHHPWPYRDFGKSSKSTSHLCEDQFIRMANQCDDDSRVSV